MEKNQQKLVNTIYYHIYKCSNTTIKEVSSSQICKFNATENSNRDFLGGTNKVILKFTGES